jgi:hypothetical protein
LEVSKGEKTGELEGVDVDDAIERDEEDGFGVEEHVGGKGN